MLLTTAAPALALGAALRPHIVMHLVDDFGHANAGWHRPPGFNETRTPVMDGLVREGIELDRAYSYQFCSPSRSTLQSGRLPVHVNTENAGTDVWNPADPVSGFQGIPRNMTCMAEHLRDAGYRTHQVGKWDAGMATVDHTPRGRGYETSLNYFCHANDYWDETCGSGGMVDLWNTTRPAYGVNGSCPQCTAPGGDPRATIGPEEIYEEHKFVQHILALIAAHDPAQPLFLNYDSHIVHEALQVPGEFFHQFDFMTDDWDYHRQLYAAMVAYLDVQVGKIVSALKGKGMWATTLWVCQSDNGGPSYTGGNHTANNWPLRGAKYSNWEGGIRVNAFVSGGLLKTAAPSRVGTKLTGYTHLADWYGTFCALAGADAVDPRAAAAGLPPLDTLDLWPYLSGAADSSPRNEIFADHGVLLQGRYKLLNGTGPYSKPGDPATVGHACFPGPVYPNRTAGEFAKGQCPVEQQCANGGCLYDIFADPTEHDNLSGDPAHAATLKKLQRRLAELEKTLFKPDRHGGDGSLALKTAKEKYGGYWGPFVFP